MGGPDVRLRMRIRWVAPTRRLRRRWVNLTRSPQTRWALLMRRIPPRRWATSAMIRAVTDSAGASDAGSYMAVETDTSADTALAEDTSDASDLRCGSDGGEAPVDDSAADADDARLMPRRRSAPVAAAADDSAADTMADTPVDTSADTTAEAAPADAGATDTGDVSSDMSWDISATADSQPLATIY